MMSNQTCKKGIKLKYLMLISSISMITHFGFSQSASEIKYVSTNVTGNIYLLNDPTVSGADNVIVSVGGEGILLVDNAFMETLNSVRPLIYELGDDVKMQINTHFHHAGANEAFAGDVTVIAHKNTQKRMSETNMMYGMISIGPWPDFALPNVIVEDSLSLSFNGEEIKLLHLPNAHTDGDLVVQFTKSNVFATGDIFVPALGVCDLQNGGKWESYLAALEILLKIIPEDAKIIPGHGPVSTYKDLENEFNMLTEVTNMVRDKINAGKSIEDIKNEGIPEKWKFMAKNGLPVDFFLGNVYQGITMN